MLAELTAGSVADAAQREAERTRDDVAREAEQQPPALDALSALQPGERINIIAEIKRASPSRGDLASLDNPADWARKYERGGASVISVLTEQRRFKGTLDDLRRVKAAVRIPVLRKDFIATDYQVLEARAAGADLILLIVAALEQEMLQQLFHLATELGMTVLVETHSAAEIERAIEIGARLIGVNARDLRTFELDRDLFGRLAPLIPEGVIKVAESAVLHPADVARYRDAGADVVLVGEALVSGDPEATLRAFLEAS